MLTEAMEGAMNQAPEAGTEVKAPFVPDYGTNSGSSAPETGNAGEQAPQAVVDGQGTGAAENSEADKPQMQTPAWMAQLPKEMRNDPELAKYRTMGDAFKDLKARAEGNEGKPVAESSEGKQEAGEGSVPVNYNNFAKRLSEGNDPLGDYTDSMIEGMQGLGIPQDKAEAIMELVDKSQNKATEHYVQEGKKFTETILQKQWGKDYQSKRALMAKGYMALGDSDGSLQKALDEQGASLSPAVWELVSRVGSLVAEDKAVTSDKGKQAEQKNPDVPVVYTY